MDEKLHQLRQLPQLLRLLLHGHELLQHWCQAQQAWLHHPAPHLASPNSLRQLQLQPPHHPPNPAGLQASQTLGPLQ